MRSNSARSSGRWPTRRSLRSSGWTSLSVRATLRSPHRTTRSPVARSAADVRRHRLEEAQLGGEILAAVGHVDRRDQRPRHAHDGDARLDVEVRVHVIGRSASTSLRTMQRDARIALRAVPVAPVVGQRELADGARDVVPRRLDLLQAQDVGLLARHEGGDFVLAGADAVHVPGRDLHGSGAPRLSSIPVVPVSTTDHDRLRRRCVDAVTARPATTCAPGRRPGTSA